MSQEELNRTRRHLRHVIGTAVFAAVAWVSQATAAPIYTVTPLVTDDQDALAANGFGPAATVDRIVLT